MAEQEIMMSANIGRSGASNCRYIGSNRRRVCLLI